MAKQNKDFENLKVEFQSIKNLKGIKIKNHGMTLE